MKDFCPERALKAPKKKLSLGLTLSFKNLHICKFFRNFALAMSNYGEKGRMELAMLYSPQLDPRAAWRKLKIWIEKCKPLAEELKQMGYTGHERIFTPKQVNRIVHYLGEY